MKKRIIVLMTLLALLICLSACGGNKPILSNDSNEDKTEKSQQEIIDSKTEDKELKIQAENGTTENMAGIFDMLNELEYQPYTCDGLPEYQLTADDGTVYAINFSDKWVRSGEIDPDNPPINWGTPDGPEIAVENYYADTVFELVSFEIVQAERVSSFV